jgi:hypothetical protein
MLFVKEASPARYEPLKSVTSNSAPKIPILHLVPLLQGTGRLRKRIGNE